MYAAVRIFITFKINLKIKENQLQESPSSSEDLKKELKNVCRGLLNLQDTELKKDTVLQNQTEFFDSFELKVF